MIFSDSIRSRISRVVEKTIGPKVPGIALKIEHQSGESFEIYKGSITNETQYFIASTTKLYITALIFKLVQTRELNLEDTLPRLLPLELISRLHVYKGMDYTDRIQLQDLLAHTSGLPDYFQAKGADGKSLLEKITKEQDQAWDLDQVLNDTRQLGGQFVPNSGKALYSDSNFQLLGRILEEKYQKRIEQILAQEIFEPLNLKKTYLYIDPTDTTPLPLNYNKKPLLIPKAMASFGPDGGIVSTADESMIFLKAFFSGNLFDSKYLDVMTERWNRIFFPLQYGVGISLFRLPWIVSPFRRIPDLTGP